MVVRGCCNEVREKGSENKITEKGTVKGFRRLDVHTVIDARGSETAQNRHNTHEEIHNADPS